MDRLLDYGDLGALVRAGFSSPSPSSSPFPVSTSPTSDSSFPGFHSPLSPSFQLPSLSTAFDALDSLPSPAPSHFSLPRLNYSAPTSAGFSPPAYSSFASSTSVFSPNSLSSASFRKLDRVDSSDFACPFAAVATPDIHSGMSMASSAVSMQSLRDQPLPLSVLRRIVAEEEKLTGAKSSRSGPCPPSRVPETQNTLERSDEIYPSNFSRSFLYPLLADQELMAISTASASTGAEKRAAAAETELSSTATADNQNRARGTKRSRKLMQKRVVHIPAVGGMSSKPSAGENVPSDMWAWRKYGQKPIKGSPHPRGYYRCSSSKGCPARKQVERNPTDPSMLVVTYTSEHNHTWPTHRINALAGSIRPPLTKSPPSLSGADVLSPNCDTSNSPLSVDMEDGPSPSPLSLDDTLRDDDLTMCKAGCQDLDATKFNATSPPSSITSAPSVIHNVVNAAKPVVPSRVWSALKSDHDTMNTGHASCTFPATSAPLTIHNVANADTSTDLRSLHESFRVRNADIKTENSNAMMLTYSTTTTLQMVHNGSNVGATFSGRTASQASPLGCNAVIPNAAAASRCAITLPASVMAHNAVKPEAGFECVAETAQQEGRALSLCVEEEAQPFDTLLSEMLEEVQRQNREVMEEEDEEALLFKWSNNINFLSQVNHLVQ